MNKLTFGRPIVRLFSPLSNRCRPTAPLVSKLRQLNVNNWSARQRCKDTGEIGACLGRQTESSSVQ